MNSRYLTDKIKAEAKSLGFFACGIAKAEAVDSGTADGYRRWIADGGHASMHYLADNIDKRLDPRLLMPGVKSIVCVALSYSPAKTIPADQYQIAYYAYGKDYHDVMKQKLHALASACGITTYRAFCDTAPVLERYWAERAGLGWTGRNHQLIIPHAGSMFFLGELFVQEELEYDSPIPNRCGRCHACLDACPTSSIISHQSSFISSRCLSYLTIEHRGPIPHSSLDSHSSFFILHSSFKNIYGCDICQLACPWNRFSVPTTDPAFQPSEALLSMTKEKWHNLTEEQYRSLFRGSAVKRAKYSGLMRNISAIAHNF
ncbi:MAG: tRNA epoxyqueuosine(34) reductase QueG [Prevotella sp.]|nr:tRNA epoxyqueuosine(34) reductase QueG [Prevotella sp.]